MSLVAITAAKMGHIVYPSGKSITIEGDNIRYAFTRSSGIVELSYYDIMSARLDYIVTTSATDINAIFAAMTSPLLANISKIDASQVSKPAIINEQAIAMRIGNTISYSLGQSVARRNKQIVATTNAGTASFAVTGVTVATKTFTVAGNQTATFTAGKIFRVDGSTGNDKLYTVVSSSFGASTSIVVKESIPDATADGTIKV